MNVTEEKEREVDDTHTDCSSLSLFVRPRLLHWHLAKFIVRTLLLSLLTWTLAVLTDSNFFTLNFKKIHALRRKLAYTHIVFSTSLGCPKFDSWLHTSQITIRSNEIVHRSSSAHMKRRRAHRSLLPQIHFTDVLLSFIDTKRGNSAEIKESQKKGAFRSSW